MSKLIRSSGCATGLCWMPWRWRTGWELLAKEISSPAVFQMDVGSFWSAGLEKSHHLLPLSLPAHVTGEFQVVRLPCPKNCFSCCLSQCLVCFSCDLLPDLLRVSEVVLLAVNRTLDAGENRRAGQLFSTSPIPYKKAQTQSSPTGRRKEGCCLSPSH